MKWWNNNHPREDNFTLFTNSSAITRVIFLCLQLQHHSTIIAFKHENDLCKQVLFKNDQNNNRSAYQLHQQQQASIIKVQWFFVEGISAKCELKSDFTTASIYPQTNHLNTMYMQYIFWFHIIQAYLHFSHL